MIYVISGKTCSGKSSVFNEIISRKYSPKPIITYTSRKPREGEVDGVDYHFVNSLTFEENPNDFVCKNLFYIEGEGFCHYGIKKSDLETDESKIVILTPSGYKELKQEYGESIYGFYLMVPDFIQYDRYIMREPNNRNVADEAVRRIAADKVDFENFEFDIEEVIINKSKTIKYISDRILERIFITDITNDLKIGLDLNGKEEVQQQDS